MKITKTAEGKTKIVLSQDEWQIIGEKAGWRKQAKCKCSGTSCGNDCKCGGNCKCKSGKKDDKKDGKKDGKKYDKKDDKEE